MFLKPQSYDVNVIAHIKPPHSIKKLYKFSFESYRVFERTSICFRMTVENFVRIVLTVFEKIEKVHNWLFSGHLRLFLESHLYNINVIAHIGPPESVKWLEKTSFESIQQFLKKLKKFTIGFSLVIFGYVSQIPALRYYCHCLYRSPI